MNCTECKGSKSIFVKEKGARVEVDCPHCGGTGQEPISDTCPRCKGSKSVFIEEKGTMVEVDCPDC